MLLHACFALQISGRLHCRSAALGRVVTPAGIVAGHSDHARASKGKARTPAGMAAYHLNLVRAGGLLVAELGPQQAWQLTTQDVSEWLLLPLVQEKQCSVATMLPDEAVGVPQHSVSHR
eukprot:scaffold311909_cov17-Tisochrysis_lutea.AAC.1